MAREVVGKTIEKLLFFCLGLIQVWYSNFIHSSGSKLNAEVMTTIWFLWKLSCSDIAKIWKLGLTFEQDLELRVSSQTRSRALPLYLHLIALSDNVHYIFLRKNRLIDLSKPRLMSFKSGKLVDTGLSSCSSRSSSVSSNGLSNNH